MKELFTDRLFLRRLRKEDAERIFSCWAHDPAVTEFLTWKPHGSVEDTKAVLDDWLAQYEKPDCFRYGIEKKSDGQLIGMIDVVGFHHGNPVIGYCLGKRYWGNGYMTEALKAVTDELFEHGYETIVIEAADENKGSNRVIQKNGFQLAASRQEKISDYNQRIVRINSYRLHKNH